MITSEIIKKFIDFYNEFKFDGKLTLEQLVFAMENFQKISYDIEDVVKVINNRTFSEYTQYNAVDFMNAVFNEQVYDLFLKERKEPKMCYWIINIEFYKIFNMYRILVLKTNLLMNTVKGALNEVTVKDFERTINIYISDSISNIRKCLDFLRRNKHTEELVFCTRPFRKLLKMDEFGRLMFQRIFPSIDPDEFAKIYETDSDDDDDELDPEVKKKLETVINNLARLDNQENSELVDPIKRLVKEALKKAGIDIDLDTNTTFTIGNNIISTPSTNKNSNLQQRNNNQQDFNNTQAFQTMMAMQNMQNQMQNMVQTQNQQTKQLQQNTSTPDINFELENFKLSKEDEDIDELLRHVSTSSTRQTKSTSNKQTSKPIPSSQQVQIKQDVKKNTGRGKKIGQDVQEVKPVVQEVKPSVMVEKDEPVKGTRGRKSVKKTI